MSDWITDRRPTAEDAHDLGYVWVTTEHGNVLRQFWNQIGDRPWMPIARPEPYVKPKRWTVRFSRSVKNWVVDDRSEIRTILFGLDRDDDQHREAAERIAAIYEEVMP